MKLDFKFNNTRYMINFDDIVCKNRDDGKIVVELRVYYSLDSDSLYSSSLKEIKNNKIIWQEWDNSYLPIEAQKHCDRLIKSLVFA